MLLAFHCEASLPGIGSFGGLLVAAGSKYQLLAAPVQILPLLGLALLYCSSNARLQPSSYRLSGLEKDSNRRNRACFIHYHGGFVDAHAKHI
jgi:hypothetical protein